MSTATTGRHSASYQELDARVRRLEADNRALIASNEDLTCALTKALVRGCQDSMRIAVAEAENRQLRARVQQLGDKVIRGAAEHARLRKAVIDARPRITVAPSAMVRPFAPEVVLPYVSPVPYRATANDETQQLAIIDQPKPPAAPVAGASRAYVEAIADEGETERLTGEAWPEYASTNPARTTWGIRNEQAGVAS